MRAQGQIGDPGGYQMMNKTYAMLALCMALFLVPWSGASSGEEYTESQTYQSVNGPGVCSDLTFDWGAACFSVPEGATHVNITLMEDRRERGLPGSYTFFGQVLAGMPVEKEIATGGMCHQIELPVPEHAVRLKVEHDFYSDPAPGSHPIDLLLPTGCDGVNLITGGVTSTVTWRLG